MDLDSGHTGHSRTGHFGEHGEFVPQGPGLGSGGASESCSVAHTQVTHAFSRGNQSKDIPKLWWELWEKLYVGR